MESVDDSRLTPDELRMAGEAMYGQRWQTDLTAALGLGDSARIRQWMSGRRSIPLGIRSSMIALLREYAARAMRLADDLAGNHLGQSND